MTGRRRITLLDKGDLLVVRGWQVQPVLVSGGIKGVFSASAGGWMVDHHRLPDVVALLELRNFPVVIVDESGGDAA